mmetsp:Transcript_27592/g.40746  ORF Transcript_27592/g.40746 Transcript_27592/m.40746 type:complete len:224 (+) Transcript_27592:39-710(+)
MFLYSFTKSIWSKFTCTCSEESSSSSRQNWFFVPGLGPLKPMKKIEFNDDVSFMSEEEGAFFDKCRYHIKEKSSEKSSEIEIPLEVHISGGNEDIFEDNGIGVSNSVYIDGPPLQNSNSEDTHSMILLQEIMFGKSKNPLDRMPLDPPVPLGIDTSNSSYSSKGSTSNIFNESSPDSHAKELSIVKTSVPFHGALQVPCNAINYNASDITTEASNIATEADAI